MELVKSADLAIISKEIVIGYDRFNFSLNAKNEFAVDKNNLLISKGHVKDPEGTREEILKFVLRETLSGTVVKLRKKEYFRDLNPYGLFLKAHTGQETYIIEKLA